MRRALLLLALALGLCAPLTAAGQQDPAVIQRISSQIQNHGRARVIVQLRLPAGAHVPEGYLSAAAATVQRSDIATVGDALGSKMQPTGSNITRRFETLPYLVLDVDAAGLSQLKAAGLHVAGIFEDKRLSPVLYESGPLVQAGQTAALGMDGTGWVVAVIDGGVDKTHPFLAGKVVSEACYVSGGGCPNGLSSQTGSGAATPSPNRSHGTHVAGIVAGNGPNAVPPPSPMMSGVAPGAQLIAINVFGQNPQAATSDVIAALNRVYSLRTTLSIASVNVSLAQLNDPNPSNCDTREGPMKSAIDQLRSVNIATVIASGDDGFRNGISTPSCISSSISVGSTTKGDVVSSFSNVASYMSLFAPGSSIYSSILNGAYGFMSGTSMSAPHVAGAWAVLRQANPSATVSQILAALRSSGVPIADTRSGGTVTASRIEIKDALALLVPGPTSISPTSGGLGATLTVTINGNNFTTGSTVSFGAGITVTTVSFLSSSQLRASISISTTATPGPRTVTVTSNNGAVGTLPNAFTVSPAPPTITSLNPNTVASGGQAFTLTVNGTKFTSASAVQVNGSNRTTTFVSATQLTAFILASDLVTSATSLAITVTTPGGGTSSATNLTLSQPSLTVSATSSPPGGTITATLNNSPSAGAWLALAQIGSADNTYLQYTFVAAGVTSRTWDVTMPATVGNYEFRLYVLNTYSVLSRSPAVSVLNINPTPSISALSPASVVAGTGAFTLAITGTGFVSGLTATVGGQSRTVSAVSPTQASIAVLAADIASTGNVAVRVSNPPNCVGNNCNSNTVNLAATAPPPAPILTSLSPATAGAGGAGFTLTATGSNFTPASLVRVDGSSRTTAFVSATQLTAPIAASDLVSSGALSITVFTPAPGGGTSGAQSLTVTGPGLTVSATSAPPGGPITATLTNSPSAGAWLALAQIGSADSTYLQYTFVAAGVTSRTWNVSMPTAVGNYEFRLYLLNTYTVLARSSAVAVINISPTPSITALSPSSVGAGSSGFILTVTGTGFASGATATVGGAARTLTFVSSTQVNVAVLTADIPASGSFPVAISVQISNPAACINGQCASNTFGFSVTAPPPAPTLTSISPATAAAGGAAFTLTATGSNFAGNSVVQVNGSARATTFLSPSQLSASILASDLGSSGVLSVTVATPAPGGGTSAAQSLTVTGPGVSVSATSTPPGGPVTATLSNSPSEGAWLALAQVGSPPNTYLQYTFVTAGVTNRTWDVSMPTALGSYEFRLYLLNTYTVLARSPAVAVVNINPTPAITALTPASLAAGSAAGALTVAGTGFVSGITATVGGQARTVSGVAPTQLSIALFAADIAATGNVAVQVTNPPNCVGGSCSSNVANLVVTAPPPAPTLTSISPATAAAGGAAFTLTATGSNFAGNSVVQVNGSARATTFLSPSQLSASILASDLGSSGVLSVTVATPAPGGGTSAAQSLTVTGPGVSVSATSTSPGGAITATISNSPSDGAWVALAQVGSPTNTYLQYTFVAAGVSNRTWDVTMPTTAGNYEFRLLFINTYTVAARSPVVTVGN